MRLHLPKGLLAALLAACFALPSEAKIETTTLTSLEVDGVTLPTGTYNQVTTDSGDSMTSLQSADVTFLKSTGGGEARQRFKVTSADTVSKAGTLVIAQASVDGSPASAGQLYLARWASNAYINSALEIKNNLVIGHSTLGYAIRLSDTDVSGTNQRKITISGDVSLGQDARIGVDNTCKQGSAFISGSIIGEGKTLSVVRSNGTEAGYLNLGTGSEGKTLTLGGLSVAGTYVTMNYGSAEVGNLSVASGASFTNAGTLEISGIFRGTTISQTGDSASLVLGKDSVINLDGLTVVQAAAWGDTPTESGWQTATANSSQYRLSDGGSVSNLGAEFRVGGSKFTATLLGGVVSLTESRYNIIADDSVAISAITEATNTEAANVPSEYYIYVSQDGTLTGVSGALGVGVSGSGTIQTSGELTFNDCLNAFTGSIELGSWGMTSSDVSFECHSNLVLTEASKITSKSGTVNTISGAISGAYGLTIAGGGVTVLANGNTSLTGDITVDNGATLKVGSGITSISSSGRVTVQSGGTFDLNGASLEANSLPVVTLAGGTLANTGTTIERGQRQLESITLTADSTIDAVADFGLIRSSFGAAELNLGANNTLTKTGGGTFYAATTTVVGTGTLRIEAGEFNFFSGTCALSNGVNVELAGGSLNVSGGGFTLSDGVDVKLSGGALSVTGGTFTNAGTSVFHGEADGTISGTITNNGTLKVTSEAGKVVTFTGAITNGANGAVLQIGDTTAEGTAISGTAKLTAALNADTVGQIKVLNGSSLILDGRNINGNYTGTIIVDEGGKMLATNNGHYNIVNGGSGKLVLNGEFTIDTTNDTNNVNGISGSGVVKTAQNAMLNIVCEASGGTSTLDESGTTTPTSYTSAFSGSVEASGSAKTVSLVFTGPSDATEDTPGSSGTTVSLKSLSATNGSTLNAKGIAVYDSEAATGGLSVSELVIGTGSKVQAWGSGDTWSASAEATVLMKGAEGAPVTLTVGTAGQTGTSTLNANLVLDGATVTLNNALTMGSTLTLNNVNLINWDDLVAANAGGGPIVLFTSVDSLTLGSGDSAVEAEADTEYAASTAFSNTNMGNYKLQMVGTAGDYTVQMVQNAPTPEPTTATLSLLALMGLAARRRRRKA